MKIKKALFLFLTIIAALAIFVLLPNRNGLAVAVKPTVQETTPTQDPESQALPVVLYAGEQEVKAVDSRQQALRIARGQRHDKADIPVVDNPEIELLAINGHWWVGLSALPVAQSDAIMIGRVDDAKAYISNNKKGVYSEFTVLVQEALKVKNGIPFPLTSIVVERFGGAVQFPSGHIQRYRVDDQGIPRIGQQYVFFLKYNEQGEDFSIVTGYELRDGQVFPLDGPATQNHLPFSTYRGAREDAFLNELHQAIAHSEQTLLENGGPR